MSTTNQQLQRYARPQLISSDQNDIQAPFSYRAWYEAHQGIIPGQEYKQYNDYLIQWYKSKRSQTTDFKTQLRLNYLTLLKQIQLFFTKEEADNWYNNVNLDSDKELLLAIPFFAKKLKDISLYYLQLRKNVKHSRLLYNQTGTESGILLQLQKFLLVNYTQRPDTTISIPPAIWKNVPALSSVKDTITLQIEELYDYHEYFDQSLSIPVSAYYDITNSDLQTFLTTKGLPLTSTDWIYRLGVYPVSAANINIGDSTLTENILLSELVKKYISQDLYTALSPILSTQKDFYNLPIEVGNNFFYWPYGPYVSSDFNPKRYSAVALSSIGLETLATAGSSIESADTIFVKTKKGIQGAWLQYIPYSRQDETMEAIIPASKKTKFKFPFPGYGLSGDDFTWTGPGFTTDNRFFFLEDKYKQAVEQTYWSTGYELTSINQIPINDTTLIDNRAYANNTYDLADKIRYWTTPPVYSDPSYTGEVKEAWLYRMNTTDISINIGDNTVYWPFEKIYTDTSFPTYFPTDVTNFCTPVPVSSVKLPFATAGRSLTAGADRIFKVSNYLDTIDNAIECCWLSGQDTFYSKYNILATKQPGLNLLIQPGQFTRFVWNGGDNASVDQVFSTFKHQPDCEFSTNPDITYKDHAKCTCRQVLFTPFGHPETKYSDNTFLADFIAEDTFTPKQINVDSTYFNNSTKYCWYKTNSKIGWGDGKWVSTDGSLYNRFYLKKGQAYIYYRSSGKTTNTSVDSLPELVVRTPYPQYESEYNKSLIWLKAIKDENDNWIATNEPSQMILYPGDTLIYSKQSTGTYSLSANLKQTRSITENRGSIWSNYDYVTVNNKYNQVVIAPPTTYYPDISVLNLKDPYKQYVNLQPPILQAVREWIVGTPSGQTISFKGTPILSFTPTLTGTYTIQLVATTAEYVVRRGLTPTSISTVISAYYDSTFTTQISTSLSTPVTYTNIPPITAISETYDSMSLTAVEVPQAGFVINVPLEGWDYNRNTYSTYAATNKGARPFWASTGVEKNEFTSYKGVESWGQALRLLDSYNVISQPIFSDIIFNIGNYVEYTRNYPVEMTWNQPVTLFYPINKNIWSTINFDTTSISNFASFLKNTQIQLTVDPTTDPTPITLTNVIEDEPVEIYYNALNSFTWPITATSEILVTTYSEPSVTTGVQSSKYTTPNLNRFNPTVAALPAFEDLYSITETGGYFTPNNLGISVYTDKDYTVEFNLSSTAYSQYFANVKKYVGGRGLSKIDQSTPYTITEENNIWLKESLLSGPIAGSINKQVFKKYQKFIPYQSGYESNPRLRVGLITPASIQTPWTGKENSEWGDLANYPKTYTGEVDVSKWADSQILKQNKLEIDNWVTDVFGNQYGLYKNLDGTLPHERKNILGEIWVRKNSQYTSPAKLALQNVFDTYKTIPLYNELTGVGIKKIDMFFDTLYVETTGAVLFEKINYDYENDNIFSLADESRQLSLPLPVTTNLNRELTGNNTFTNIAKVGETWFFPNEKKVIISICGLNNTFLTPELYLLDTNRLTFDKVFPVKADDISLIADLSSLNITSIGSPVLTYNPLKKEYVLSLQADNNIIEFNIKDLPVLELTDIIVYTATTQTSNQLPPYISQELKNIIATNTVFTYDVSTSTASTFVPVSLPSWLSLSQTNSNTGNFSGTSPDTAGTYYAEFYVENSVGKTYYTLSIIVQ